MLSYHKKSINHWDMVAYQFLKASSHTYAPYPGLFFNFILTKDIFSNNCKIAKVTVIYKMADDKNLNVILIVQYSNSHVLKN